MESGINGQLNKEVRNNLINSGKGKGVNYFLLLISLVPTWIIFSILTAIILTFNSTVNYGFNSLAFYAIVYGIWATTLITLLFTSLPAIIGMFVISAIPYVINFFLGRSRKRLSKKYCYWLTQIIFFTFLSAYTLPFLLAILH